jgi:tRNA pseudouridine13 synthase
MYILKEIPEDFVVIENIKLDLQQKGKYSYYLLSKQNLTTSRSLELISNSFKVNPKFINVAGLKDKNAVTSQHVSILHGKEKNFTHNNLQLKFIGKGNERLKLGNFKSNSFKITARNLNKKYHPINFIENYFDEQRFSKQNVEIGKLLLQKNFKKVISSLDINSDNPINDLKKIKNLRFYLHSYQSYLFNRYLSNLIVNSSKKQWNCKYSLGKFNFSDLEVQTKIPLISFDTDLKEFPFYEEILNEENISLDDFIIKQLPHLIDETTFRASVVKVEDLKITYEKDEIYENKNKAILSFSLPPGSYATILLKKIFTQPQ